MACQFFQHLIAGEGPSALQHALVGIGCLLAYDALSRWRKHRRQLAIYREKIPPSDRPSADETEQRRAA
jgi:hypothetical protein